MREHEEARLLARHELLDHHPGAGAFGEDRVERRVGVGAGVAATVTPLPAARPSALTTIGAPSAATQARAACGSVKVWLGGGRRAAGGADLLGEGLRGLEPRRRAAGAEGEDAAGAQHVGDAFGQRRLGADHDEVDGVLGAEGEDLLAVEDVERHAGRLLGDAGVAGRAPEPVAFRVLREGPGQRVLAAAAAEDEDVHGQLRAWPRSPRVLGAPPPVRKREACAGNDCRTARRARLRRPEWRRQRCRPLRADRWARREWAPAAGALGAVGRLVLLRQAWRSASCRPSPSCCGGSGLRRWRSPRRARSAGSADAGGSRALGAPSSAWGCSTTLVPFSLIVWAQTQIASGLASILNATTPLFTVLLAHWPDRRRAPDAGRSARRGARLRRRGHDDRARRRCRGSGGTSLAELASSPPRCPTPLPASSAGASAAQPPLVTAAGQVTASARDDAADRAARRPALDPGDAGAARSRRIAGLALLSTALAYVIYLPHPRRGRRDQPAAGDAADPASARCCSAPCSSARGWRRSMSWAWR